MSNHENARKYIRSNISIAARITPAEAASFDVTVVDLSLNGILVQTGTTLAVGSKCKVVMLVGHYMHELPISADGVVIRAQDRYIAICFDALGIETPDELQNMILFHSDHPEQCLSEFEQCVNTPR